MSLPIKYRIMGLDNSRYCTGWCVIDVDNEKVKLIDYGYIDTKKIFNEGDTLIYIEKFFNDIMEKYNPDYLAAEAMFIGQNARTSMTLAHIHGVMLLVARKKNLNCIYYSVMTLKSTILGGIKTKKEDGTKKTGDEMKEEVAVKVIEILGKENFTKKYTNDVTDALSAALVFKMRDGEPVEKIKKPKKIKKEKTEEEKIEKIKKDKPIKNKKGSK